ncbi:DNA-3-methyladenine glycosylase I [Pelolinea submarina]|uniref:DNA-3-methyladenine glycosylase I n=1 Tax=Pelolinea submarina TaxID=913107 RepID=A0A3E0AFV5_9CHLR|nr:DNA-3-methyladenine glycosylase I [Pelolinea submarina]REG10557.1 DNA-3-methyladenine glycosylase I [Pelolinea submarina]
MKNRCQWAQDPQFHEYHDAEWGVPVHDDRKHYEFLLLEGAQAGLSWATILKKREGYRKAFADFDPEKVAQFTAADFNRLLLNTDIIRNKLKIRSAINNAQRFLDVRKEFGSFDAYIWQFVGNKPIVNTWEQMSQIPAVSQESELLSKDLKNRGFNFVGPTIVYAHMQAVGMVNDHEVSCFRYKEVQD